MCRRRGKEGAKGRDFLPCSENRKSMSGHGGK